MSPNVPQCFPSNFAPSDCAQSSIKNKCLSFALTNKIHYGIWGGLTEIERKSVLRKQYREGSYGQM